MFDKFTLSEEKPEFKTDINAEKPYFFVRTVNVKNRTIEELNNF